MNKFEELNASVASLIEQSTLTQEIETAQKEYSLVDNKSVFNYDMLRMYFGDDYKVTEKIIIHQPSIQEIIDYGERDFYSMVYSLCTNPTGVRLQLWQNGVDWNKISDYELFASLIQSFNVEDTKILFGDLDFTKFIIQPLDDNDSEINEANDDVKKEAKGKKNKPNFTLIYLPDIDIEIDELVYNKIIDYLRTMFNIHPKVEKAKDKFTKEALIEEDQMNLRASQAQNKTEDSSILLPLISAAVNHPGFKYKKNELREVKIVEFMDSIRRLQLYENSIALMHGVYGGFLDTSKMDVGKETNFMRDIYEKEEPPKKRKKKSKDKGNDQAKS